MGNEETLEPIRFSALKHMAKSPMHVRHYLDHGRDDKPWLRGGRGLHCVLFEQPYVVYEGDSRRGKAWDKFCLENSERDEFQIAEVILAKELATYQAMARSIRAELARQNMSHLLEGDIERRIAWEWLGRSCAGTPDVAGELFVADVKTTCNADPSKFHWDARRFSYSEQLAWYARGIQLNLDGVDLFNRELYIIAVEKTAPHPVVIWRVTDKMREQAERTLRLWFEQLLACEASNQWPGYAQCVQPLDVLESDGVTLQIGGEDVEVE